MVSSILYNMLKKAGVADDEILTALPDYYKKEEGKVLPIKPSATVSKQEVIDAIKANSVEFQDVVLGENKLPWSAKETSDGGFKVYLGDEQMAGGRSDIHDV